MCCRFPNRGVQNGQAAGRRTRAHRCRHRGRVCGHAGSARADGVKNKPWFVVGLDLRNTVRKQLSCGSCLSERGRCFFNIGTKFLQSFVFIKCGDGKAGPTLSRPRNLATKCAVRASLGWALSPLALFSAGLWTQFWTQTSQKKLEYGAALSTSDNSKRSPNATFCDSQHTEPGALFVFYKG